MLLIALWTVFVIYPQWGEWALFLLFMGHLGLRLISSLLVYPVLLLKDKDGALALRCVLGMVGSIYLVYLSVHWFSWWCFWAIFLTFVSFTATMEKKGDSDEV